MIQIAKSNFTLAGLRPFCPPEPPTNSKDSKTNVFPPQNTRDYVLPRRSLEKSCDKTDVRPSIVPCGTRLGFYLRNDNSQHKNDNRNVTAKDDERSKGWREGRGLPGGVARRSRGQAMAHESDNMHVLATARAVLVGRRDQVPSRHRPASVSSPVQSEMSRTRN